MNRAELPVLIFGTAGAAKDIYYWIKASNEYGTGDILKVVGFIENDPAMKGQTIFAGQTVIGTDEEVADIIKDYDEIGMVVPFGSPYVRQRIVEELKGFDNAVFPNIIHPTVIYDKDAGTMGEGNHIGPGVVIESEYTFGDFNYVSGAVELGHDMKMGDYNSINPSAATAGNVVFGNRSMLGLNACVIQELHVGDDIVIGAGAVVTQNLSEPGIYAGVPAKKIK